MHAGDGHIERFSATTIFWIVWLTTSILLLALGDFNLYSHFPDGRVILKHRAEFLERLLFSVAIGGLVGAVNLLLLHVAKRVRDSLKPASENSAARFRGRRRASSSLF